MQNASKVTIIYNKSILSKSLRNADDVVDYLNAIWDMGLFHIQEQVYILYMNNLNQVICWNCLHSGTCDSVSLDTRLAAACGLVCMATKAVISHNHPSGTLTPTAEDIEMTCQLRDVMKIAGITLIDHIIMAESGYYSFKKNKLLD